MIDQPVKSTVEAPVLNNSIHSPSGKAIPSELLFDKSSENTTSDGVVAMRAKSRGLLAFGVG